MRIGLSAFIVALLVTPGEAQSPKRVGVVNPPGTTARAGPSSSFPDTGHVAAGTRVVVVRTEGDFVVVEPPEGQRSWMPALVLIDPDAQPGQPGAVNPGAGRWDAVVAPDGPAEIPVLAGDADRPKPLAVQRLTVPAGTIVTVTGPAVEHNRAKWVPVEPPPGDYRYLPQAAVEMTANPAPSFAVSSPPNSGTLLAAPIAPATAPPPPDWSVRSQQAPDGPPPPPSAPTEDPLWAEAESATAARDYRQAEKLYLQLAARMNHADRRAAAAACFARLHQVRSLAVSAGPAVAPSTPGAWHGPGTLQPTALEINGRETYAVRQRDGKTLCYVLADAGVDLARFRGYQVELYGPSEGRAALNGVPLVLASRVQQARR